MDENIFVWKIFFEIRTRTHILWTALKFVTIASDFSATQTWAKILNAELQGRADSPMLDFVLDFDLAIYA